MRTIRLDELYTMVAHIYGEQNAIRPVSATLVHFVEVCGMLTIHDRSKKREGLDFVDALCKALGWYFPLLAKLNVKSVEEIVYRKYPYACPYCRETPHKDMICKTVLGTNRTVDHDGLRAVYEKNQNRRPVGLDDWQKMFQDIYPRSPEDKGRSTLGLFEELGELAESVRVFEKYPKYFAGEAADIFSYLMGLANEFALRQAQQTGLEFSFEREFLRRYPGLCTQCGFRICICPSVPPATVGRMSKELDIEFGEKLFAVDPEEFARRGEAASALVLSTVGGYEILVDRFPADRGDANRAFIVLCLKLAQALEGSRPELAEHFRGMAVSLGTTNVEAGSANRQVSAGEFHRLLAALRDAWREVGSAAESDSELASNPLALDLAKSISKLRVLFVYASPKDQDALHLPGELRAIREAIQLAGQAGYIELDDLPAATIDDLRRALLKKEYEVVHFSGHANDKTIVLENPDGYSASVDTAQLSELFKRHSSINCLVLSACDSASDLSVPIAPFTIGMTDTVDDEAAIEFARGFYDALSHGKDIEFAVKEGQSAATLKGYEEPPVKLLMM